MNKRLLQVLALAVCLGLLPAAAYAKGKSSSGHGFTDKGKRHNDHDRDDRHARGDFRHDHDRIAGGGPPNRPAGWDQGNKTGWGDCNVPPGLAKKRGCDSRGFSTRERGIRTSHTQVGPRTTRSARTGSTTVTRRPATATTSRATRPGETRGIILQRDAASKQAVQK